MYDEGRSLSSDMRRRVGVSEKDRTEADYYKFPGFPAGFRPASTWRSEARHRSRAQIGRAARVHVPNARRSLLWDVRPGLDARFDPHRSNVSHDRERSRSYLGKL